MKLPYSLPHMLVSLALMLISSWPLAAADGDLDLSLDGDGIATVQVSAGYNDRTEDLLILLDGSILIAGSMQYSSTDHDFAVVKLHRLGWLDPTFGNSGKVTIAFDIGGGWADHGMAIAQQADGKLVVAGYVETATANDFDLAVARLLSDGSLDSSFGAGGKATIAVNLGGDNFDIATDVLIQSDGKIVLTGSAERAGDDSDFVAVRLLANGTLDTAFGFQGKAVVAFDFGGLNRDEANAAALQNDGKILLAGSVERANGDFDFAAIRLLSNGSLDSSFGSGGKATVAFDRGGADQDYAEAVTLDSSGRIVLAGRSEGATYFADDFAVARLLASGSLDSSFSSDGKTTVGINVGLGIDQASAVVVAPGNKLIVAGTAFLDTKNSDFAAVRLHDDGSVDSQFGNNGKTRVAFDIGGDKRDEARAMAIGIDGGIVMAGPADTHWDLTLTGVIRLQGAPWLWGP